MNEIAKQAGEIFVNALVGAIQAGKDRRAAQDAAAEAVRRADIVSDKLWIDLGTYIAETKDFEEDGAG